MPKKKTAWMLHLAKVFAAGKKRNPNYKYSAAMRDAKKSYRGS